MIGVGKHFFREGFPWEASPYGREICDQRLPEVWLPRADSELSQQGWS